MGVTRKQEVKLLLLAQSLKSIDATYQRHGTFCRTTEGEVAIDVRSRSRVVEGTSIPVQATDEPSIKETAHHLTDNIRLPESQYERFTMHSAKLEALTLLGKSNPETADLVLRTRRQLNG